MIYKSSNVKTKTITKLFFFYLMSHRVTKLVVRNYKH